MCHSSGVDGLTYNDEGKVSLGCLFSSILLCLAIFITVKVGPPYFAYKDFESDMKTEASRAGAHLYNDETVAKEILALAEKNGIRLTREDIKVERFAGQIQLSVHYAVPLDFVVYERDMEFDIKVSSFIGRL